jgi:hypothetical protein
MQHNSRCSTALVGLVAIFCLFMLYIASVQAKSVSERPVVVAPVGKRLPPRPQPANPVPIITGITPTDPDGAPYVYLGGKIVIKGASFPTAKDDVWVVISDLVDPNTWVGAPSATRAEFHPDTATATQLAATAPASLAGRAGRYSVWVKTAAGKWSRPVAVYFAGQPAPPPTALIEVGTFDAATGEFDGLVTQEVEYQAAPGKPVLTKKVVPTVTVTEPWVKLSFHVRNNDVGNFVVSVSPDYSKETPAADNVVVLVGQATLASWRVSARGRTYRDQLNIKHVEPTIPPKQAALTALDDFDRSSHPGRFTRIDKAKLITQIKARINDPTVMYQGQENLCGPVAVLVALAQKNPARYVQMARSMYEEGKFAATPDYVIKPGSHLYTMATPASMTGADVDWMLAASMRDHENAVFDMDPGDKVAAYTTPGEVKKWFSKLLQCPRTNYESCYVYGEKAALQAGATALANGAAVALMIDANFLPGNNPSWWDQATNLPNHWVLLQKVDSASAPYNFTVFTWGRVQPISGMSQGRLEDLLWGVVIGYK